MSKAPMTKRREFKWISHEDIIKNENNPREEREFSPSALEQLRRSIKTHGILEPVIVTPYDGQYKLLEGERRWQTARLEDIQEMPAVIVNKMSDLDELSVMFNIHLNRRGWEMAEQLMAIKRLREAKPGAALGELADELGMGPATLRERLAVLDMGDEVVADIAKDKIEYSSAMRAHQIAGTVRRSRPEVTQRLGGEKEIEKALLKKARLRGAGKGISQELVAARKELADIQAVPDDAVEHYIKDPKADWRDVRKTVESVEEKREVEELARKAGRLEKELKRFDVELEEAPNLRDLRLALSGLIEAAQLLEIRVSKALKRRDDQAR